MGTLRIHLLGPLLVQVDGETVPLPGGRPAALLAVLALASGRSVTTEELVEQIWGDREGRHAQRPRGRHFPLAQGARRRRGRGQGGGYRLTVPADDIDVSRFTGLVEKPHGSPRARLTRVEEALALWRGEPLAGVGIDLPIALGHLRELRLRAQELAAELRLELDEHHRVAAELPALVAANPLREQLTTLLMAAQYRCGRQSEALQAFECLRKTLAEELGVAPGPGARRMHQRILEADPELDVGGSRAKPAPGERRDRHAAGPGHRGDGVPWDARRTIGPIADGAVGPRVLLVLDNARDHRRRPPPLKAGVRRSNSA